MVDEIKEEVKEEKEEGSVIEKVEDKEIEIQVA